MKLMIGSSIFLALLGSQASQQTCSAFSISKPVGPAFTRRLPALCLSETATPVSKAPFKGSQIEAVQGSDNTFVIRIDGEEAELGGVSADIYKKITESAKKEQFQGFRPGTIPPHLEPTYRAFSMDACAREATLVAMEQANISPLENARDDFRFDQISIKAPEKKPKKKKGGKKSRKDEPTPSEDLSAQAPTWLTFESMESAIKAGWKPGQDFSFVAKNARGQPSKSDSASGEEKQATQAPLAEADAPSAEVEPPVEAEVEAEAPVVEAEVESEAPVAEAELEAESPVAEVEVEAEAPVEVEVEAEAPVEVEVEAEAPVVEAEVEAESPVVEAELEAEAPVVEAEVEAEAPVVEAEVEAEAPVVEAEAPVTEAEVSVSEIKDTQQAETSAEVEEATVVATPEPEPVKKRSAEDYAAMSPEERAFAILVDSGTIAISPDPDDPNYDSSMDDEYCDENVIPEGFTLHLD